MHLFSANIFCQFSRKFLLINFTDLLNLFSPVILGGHSICRLELDSKATERVYCKEHCKASRSAQTEAQFCCPLSEAHLTEGLSFWKYLHWLNSSLSPNQESRWLGFCHYHRSQVVPTSLIVFPMSSITKGKLWRLPTPTKGCLLTKVLHIKGINIDTNAMMPRTQCRCHLWRGNPSKCQSHRLPNCDLEGLGQQNRQHTKNATPSHKWYTSIRYIKM